jgi:hypothetical protein
MERARAWERTWCGCDMFAHLTESSNMHPGLIPHLLTIASSTTSTSRLLPCSPSLKPTDPAAPGPAAVATERPPLADELENAPPSRQPTVEPSTGGEIGGIRRNSVFPSGFLSRICLCSLVCRCITGDDLAITQRPSRRAPRTSKGGTNAPLPATEPASSTVSAAGRDAPPPPVPV